MDERSKMATGKHELAIAFQHRIDEWVTHNVGAGINDFGDLLKSLPGVYPTAILDAVERLTSRGRLSKSSADQIRRQACDPAANSNGQSSLLPLPHPLDFEWRFTSDASRMLLGLATSLTRRDEAVGLFGTPGVAVEALTNLIERPLTFFGEDNAVTRRLTALNQAMGAPLDIRLCNMAGPPRQVKAIIVDPPWYLDFVRPMLGTTALLCQMHGFVLATLPSEGTRASAAEQRATTLRYAQRLGLELVATYESTIEYETPFFEANALRANGLHISYPWRRGDLLVFKKTRDVRTDLTVSRVREDRWLEVEIGRMRLLIKRHGGRVRGFEYLRSLVDGDIFPSVSRRDPRRRKAQVWTSGNRLFASDNPELLINAALSLSADQSTAGIQRPLCGSIDEREAVERVSSKLSALADREAAEERETRPLTVGDRGTTWKSRLMNFTGELGVRISG